MQKLGKSLVGGLHQGPGGVGECFRGEGRLLPETVEGKLQLSRSQPMGVCGGTVGRGGYC